MHSLTNKIALIPGGVLIFAFSILGLIIGVQSPKIYAAPGASGAGNTQKQSQAKDVSTIDCEQVNCSDPAADPDAECNSSGCDLVKTYVNPTIRVLSVLVALVATVSLIVGGIQYSAAGSDPQKISSAKDRISKTIIAFVAYFFLAAFLEFLVPGGIFRG